MSLDHLCETKWSQNDVTWSLVSQSGLVEQKISRTPNSKFINFWYLRCVLPKRFKEINVTVTRLIFSTDFATSRNNSPLRSFFNNKITHNSSNHVHWIGMLILRFSQHYKVSIYFHSRRICNFWFIHSTALSYISVESETLQPNRPPTVKDHF